MLKICSEKAPYYFYDGGNVQDVFLFNESGIVSKFDDMRIELAEIKGDHIETVNKYHETLVGLNIGKVKRKNKIDLTKKENFIIKSDSNVFLRKPYDLYIYAGVGSDVEIVNFSEYKYGSGLDGEQWFMMGYKLKFNRGAFIKKGMFEKIICDNYTLKDGERFGDGYGTKENPIVRWFDTSKHLLPGRKPEHGIIKSWYETQTTTEQLTIKGTYISRKEQTEERKNREKLAENIKNIIGYDIPDCTMVELLKHYNITEVSQNV